MRSKVMIEIFQVTGSFGIRGGVKIRSYTDDLDFYKNVYDAAGEKFSIRTERNGAVVYINGVSDRTAADALRGKTFYAARNDLKETKPNEFYICDLAGQEVSVENSDVLCKIVSVQNYGAGDLLELSFNGKKFLVPFTKQNFPYNELIISQEAFEDFVKNVAG